MDLESLLPGQVLLLSQWGVGETHLFTHSFTQPLLYLCGKHSFGSSYMPDSERATGRHEQETAGPALLSFTSPVWEAASNQIPTLISGLKGGVRAWDRGPGQSEASGRDV